MTLEPGPYQVLYDNVARELKELRDRSFAKGTARELLEALKLLHAALQVDPLNFGDPIRVKENVHVLHRLLQPLNVTYAVHVEHKLVYLQKVTEYTADAE